MTLPSTAFSNGPTTGTVQGNFVVDLMVKMRNEKKRSVEAVKEAEDKWVKELNEIWYSSLFPPTDSWYQGINLKRIIRCRTLSTFFSFLRCKHTGKVT